MNESSKAYHAAAAESSVRSADLWTEAMRSELAANRYNGCVGSELVSETQRVRVWHLRLPPGKRCPFHRHVLDYFWTCHTSGVARGYFEDGRVIDVEHYPGHTKHMTYKQGEHLLHSVENIGNTELVFTTVEFLDGANAPLKLPADVRRAMTTEPSAFPEVRAI